MANHSATKKSIRKTVNKTVINKNRKTRIKTYIKRVINAVESGSSSGATKALIEGQSEIMRGIASNIIKKNTGSRKISRLASKVKAISNGTLQKKVSKLVVQKVASAKTATSTTKEAAKPVAKK